MRQTIAIGVVSLVLAGHAAAQDAMEVTASALNVRTGPSTGHGVIGTAGRGQVYPVLGRQGEWVKLQFGSKVGWSHGGYLSGSQAPVRAVTASSLNVRTGPGTGYRDIGDLPRGTKVAVRAQSGDWRRIDYEGRQAFVHSAYLGAASGGGGAVPQPPSRPRSAAGFIQLRASGPGFYATALSGRRWGKPALVYGIERAAARWKGEAPNGPRIGVGEISLTNGGSMPPHVSHRVGEDVDVRPMRTSGEGPVTIYESAYSRSRTARVIQLMRQEITTELVLFNDRGVPGVITYPNHHHHFHLRMR